MDDCNKTITITLPEDCRVLPPLYIFVSSTAPQPVLDTDLYKKLIDCKAYIQDTHRWDFAKKLTNEYELIYVSNKYKNIRGIAKYKPLSRSYYKLIEILNNYNIINDENHSIKTGHIAEGPGGFMEAIVNYRKNKSWKNHDFLYGISLKHVDKEIPGWVKARDFLKRNQNINISYGKDDTGNIYNVENIVHFAETIDGKCDIVTADGGFDFSVDFNKQEQLAHKLIFCEIVCCLSIQKIGGTFICKFFDMYTTLTLKFLHLLNCLYDSVTVTKPCTSRPANSEKYVIAKGFRGIDPNYLKYLYRIITDWQIIENSGIYVVDIFNNILDTGYLTILSQYNRYNTTLQIKNIHDTLYYLENHPDCETITMIRQHQISKAVEWCNKYTYTG